MSRSRKIRIAVLSAAGLLAGIGLILGALHTSAAKRYVLATPTSLSKLAQALIVDTEAGAWWIEYRSRPFRGLLFRFVDNSVVPSPFAESAVLITKPTKARRPWLALGESYRIPGSFRVTLTKAVGGWAEVRLR